jgi:hypothetical protein
VMLGLPIPSWAERMLTDDAERMLADDPWTTIA